MFPFKLVVTWVHPFEEAQEEAQGAEWGSMATEAAISGDAIETVDDHIISLWSKPRLTIDLDSFSYVAYFE